MRLCREPMFLGHSLPISLFLLCLKPSNEIWGNRHWQMSLCFDLDFHQDVSITAGAPDLESSGKNGRKGPLPLP